MAWVCKQAFEYLECLCSLIINISSTKSWKQRAISCQCCVCWKPNKMKIIQITQKNLLYLGIGWYYSMQKYPINRRNLLAFSVLSITTIIDCIYLFHVAATFNEYANSVYTCLTILQGTVIFAFVTCRMRMIFECLNQIEKISNDREFIHHSLHCKNWIEMFQGINLLHRKPFTRKQMQKWKNGVKF